MQAVAGFNYFATEYNITGTVIDALVKSLEFTGDPVIIGPNINAPTAL
jgi:hypothetical protein